MPSPQHVNAKLHALAATMTEYRPLMSTTYTAANLKPIRKSSPLKNFPPNLMEVPLVATLEFLAAAETSDDSDKFGCLDYRLGMDQNRLLSGDFTEFPPFLTLAILQQWLYFGFIETFTGYSVHIPDFLGVSETNRNQKHVIIDTNAYEGPVLQLYYFLGHKYTRFSILAGPGYNDEDPYQSRMEAALQCLTGARHFLNRFQRQFYDLCPPIGATVHTSMLMLGEMLQLARDRVPDVVLSVGSELHVFESAESWGPAPMIEERLLAASWCPGEVKRLCNSMNVCNQYFASLLPRLGPESHQQCSAEACVSSQITGVFTGSHLQSCTGRENGTCGGLGPNVEQVVKILRSGGIPLIEIFMSSSSDDAQVDLRVIEANNKTTSYTAVSHVWSDGLGNSEANEIFFCQLRYIYDCLQSLRKQQRSSFKRFGELVVQRVANPPVILWLDTFCVPVGEENRSDRNRAIERMAQTYSDAKNTLVLDSEIRQASVSHNRSELIMRLYCSAWMRRLWTLQEGVLASRRLCLQLSDGIVNLFDDVWRKGFKKAYSTMEGNGARARYGVIKHYLRNFYEYESLVFLHRFTRLSDFKETPLPQRFAMAWDEVRWRNTSRVTDMTVCFAGILGLNPKELFQTQGEAEDSRLRKLLELCSRENGELPSTILFAEGPHMTDVPGWSWAPASLPRAYRSMTLQLPRAYGRRKRMVSSAKRDAGGLKVNLSGFLLAPRDLPLRLPCTIFYGEGFTWHVSPESPRWEKGLGNTHVPLTLGDQRIGSSNRDTRSRFGLILSDGVAIDFLISSPRMAQARHPRSGVVVLIANPDEAEISKGPIYCKYLARVTVSLSVGKETPERGPNTESTRDAQRNGFGAEVLRRITADTSPVLLVGGDQEWYIQ